MAHIEQTKEQKIKQAKWMLWWYTTGCKEQSLKTKIKSKMVPKVPWYT